MEKLFIQGKGDDQIQLSVNVSKEEEAMMRSIKEEGIEVWTDRDVDLYKEAKRRLENEVDILKPKKVVIEDVQQEKKAKKKKGVGTEDIVLIILGCIVVAGIIWFIESGGIVTIAIVLFLLKFSFDSLFGKGK